MIDLKMPSVSGLELLRWLREQPEFQTLPIILTSSSHRQDLLAAFSLGANGYVIKPGNSDQLLNLVRALQPFWSSESIEPGWVRLRRKPTGAAGSDQPSLRQ